MTTADLAAPGEPSSVSRLPVRALPGDPGVEVGCDPHTAGVQSEPAPGAVGAMGLVFALVYLWRGSLVAPMVMHFLQNFLAIVLVPWLGLR